MLVFIASLRSYAVSSKKAQYDGGTVAQIPKSETGTLVTGDSGLIFTFSKNDHSLHIHYGHGLWG